MEKKNLPGSNKADQNNNQCYVSDCGLPLHHGTIRKSLVIYATQLTGSLLLKKLNILKLH